MAKVAGSLWVSGTELHYVDKNGAEWYFVGADTGVVAGARAGSPWIDNTDSTIRYIDAFGHMRKVSGVQGTDRSGAGARQGSTWVETSANVDYSLAYIANASFQYAAHIPSSSIIIASGPGAGSYTSSFFLAPTFGGQPLTVTTNTDVIIYGAAGGGGGGQSSINDRPGGEGGGGGASNNSGMMFTLVAGKNYVVTVGIYGETTFDGGVAGQGSETSLFNSTDGVWLFRFQGGFGGSFSSQAGSRLPGVVQNGVGVDGGTGGYITGQDGTGGTFNFNGAGGGGAGGAGSGGVAVGPQGNGAAGGGPGAQDGTSWYFVGGPDTVYVGGDGGNGGGVLINVPGVISGRFGGGGGGHGGSPSYNSFNGNHGSSGVMVFSFIPTPGQPIFLG